MAKRLRRHKRRLRDRHKARLADEQALPAAAYVLAPPGDEGTGEAADEHPVVIAETATPIVTMTVSEAVMRLDLADQPALLFRNSAHGRLNLVSLGVVSGVGPFEDAAQLGSEVGIEIFEVVYTDAHVAPGSSGAPLLDGQGRVIGVVDAVLGGPSGLSGIGMAIPAGLVRQSIQDLEKYGLPQRGWLGVTLVDLTDLDPLLLKALGLYGEKGAMIDRVEPDSPAAKAGLRGAERDQLGKLVALGDVILAVNGQPVRNRFEVIQAVARHRPGDRVTLTLWRNGKRVEVEVTLTVRR